jgi:hypothetical protein
MKERIGVMATFPDGWFEDGAGSFTDGRWLF